MDDKVTLPKPLVSAAISSSSLLTLLLCWCCCCVTTLDACLGLDAVVDDASLVALSVALFISMVVVVLAGEVVVDVADGDAEATSDSRIDWGRVGALFAVASATPFNEEDEDDDNVVVVDDEGSARVVGIAVVATPPLSLSTAPSLRLALPSSSQPPPPPLLLAATFVISIILMLFTLFTVRRQGKGCNSNRWYRHRTTIPIPSGVGVCHCHHLP